MKLRRTHISQVRGNAWEQKALALAIWLKKILHNSRLEHYSLGRLSSVSGVSYRALKTYMAIMHVNDYVHYEGTEKNKVLVIDKIASKRSSRNIDISEFDFSSFKDVYNSLRSFIMARIQARKDYVRQLLQIHQNPGRDVNFRAVRRKVRNLVQCGVLKGMHDEYKEYGLSLRKIAEEVGCCVKTAEKVVKYALDRKWVSKKRLWCQKNRGKVSKKRVFLTFLLSFCRILQRFCLILRSI